MFALLGMSRDVVNQSLKCTVLTILTSGCAVCKMGVSSEQVHVLVAFKCWNLLPTGSILYGWPYSFVATDQWKNTLRTLWTSSDLFSTIFSFFASFFLAQKSLNHSFVVLRKVISSGHFLIDRVYLCMVVGIVLYCTLYKWDVLYSIKGTVSVVLGVRGGVDGGAYGWPWLRLPLLFFQDFTREENVFLLGTLLCYE